MDQVTKRLNKVINHRVNVWFHGMRTDGQSPEYTVNRLCDVFLIHCKRFGLSLVCSESQFRRNICEATCIMYVAQKQNVAWYGPFSQPERPTGWIRTDEAKWLEYIRFHCFSYSLWTLIWEYIGTPQWGSILPYWHIHMEQILLHYIKVMPECIEDMETMEGHEKGTMNDIGNVEDV